MAQLIEIIWLLLPAYLCNMAPLIINLFFHKEPVPIDFGRNIFGNNKTYRGMFAGILFSVLVVYIQKATYQSDYISNISLISYNNYSPVLLGLLMGIGCNVGVLLNSFIKRRLQLKPGSRFIPLDQIDYLLGFYLFLSFVVFPGWKFFFYSLLFSFFVSILINRISFSIGIRKTKW